MAAPGDSKLCWTIYVKMWVVFFKKESNEINGYKLTALQFCCLHFNDTPFTKTVLLRIFCGFTSALTFWWKLIYVVYEISFLCTVYFPHGADSKFHCNWSTWKTIFNRRQMFWRWCVHPSTHTYAHSVMNTQVFHDIMKLYWKFGQCSVHISKQMMSKQNQLKKVTSLRSRLAIWRHRSGSTLFEAFTCYLMVSSHCLNHCWLKINTILWYLFGGNCTSDSSTINHRI